MFQKLFSLMISSAFLGVAFSRPVMLPKDRLNVPIYATEGRVSTGSSSPNLRAREGVMDANPQGCAPKGLVVTSSSCANGDCKNGMCDLPFNSGQIWTGDKHGNINIRHIFLSQTAGYFTPGNGKPANGNFVDIMKNFVKGLTGSALVDILNSYATANEKPATKFTFVDQKFPGPIVSGDVDPTSIGDLLISLFPRVDPNTFYVVFLDPSLTYQGVAFPNNGFCGFHQIGLGSFTGSVAVIYASDYGCGFFAGGADSVAHTGVPPDCSSGNCVYYPPNNNADADTAVATYSHEILEHITDYQQGYWSSNDGNICYGSEAGDICASSFSNIAWTGSFNYNLNLSTGYFMTQDWWVNRGPYSYCNTFSGVSFKCFKNFQCVGGAQASNQQGWAGNAGADACTKTYPTFCSKHSCKAVPAPFNSDCNTVQYNFKCMKDKSCVGTTGVAKPNSDGASSCNAAFPACQGSCTATSIPLAADCNTVLHYFECMNANTGACQGFVGLNWGSGSISEGTTACNTMNSNCTGNSCVATDASISATC